MDHGERRMYIRWYNIRELFLVFTRITASFHCNNNVKVKVLQRACLVHDDLLVNKEKRNVHKNGEYGDEHD